MIFQLCSIYLLHVLIYQLCLKLLDQLTIVVAILKGDSLKNCHESLKPPLMLFQECHTSHGISQSNVNKGRPDVQDQILKILSIVISSNFAFSWLIHLRSSLQIYIIRTLYYLSGLSALLIVSSNFTNLPAIFTIWHTTNYYVSLPCPTSDL